MKIYIVYRGALVTVASVSRRNFVDWWGGESKDSQQGWDYVKSCWTLVRNVQSSSLPHPGYAPKFPDNFCIISGSLSSMKTILLYHWKHIFPFDWVLVEDSAVSQSDSGTWVCIISPSLYIQTLDKQWKGFPATMTRTLDVKVLPRALQTHVGSCNRELIC